MDGEINRDIDNNKDALESIAPGVLFCPNIGEITENSHTVAAEFKKYMGLKKKHVMFNGKEYLENPDWQFLGAFYSITTKVISTERVDYGHEKGFSSVVQAIRLDKTISSAESICLNSERNWKSKDSFQLLSMAQTRASSKTLRLILAWIPAMAGFAVTPAEEMDGVFNQEVKTPAKAGIEPAKTKQPTKDNEYPDWYYGLTKVKQSLIKEIVKIYGKQVLSPAGLTEAVKGITSRSKYFKKPTESLKNISGKLIGALLSDLRTGKGATPKDKIKIGLLELADWDRDKVNTLALKYANTVEIDALSVQGAENIYNDKILPALELRRSGEIDEEAPI